MFIFQVSGFKVKHLGFSIAQLVRHVAGKIWRDNLGCANMLTHRPSKWVIQFGYRSCLCSVQSRLAQSCSNRVQLGSSLVTFGVNDVRVKYGFGLGEIRVGFVSDFLQ